MKNIIKNRPGLVLALIATIVISAIVIKESLFYRWFGHETIPNVVIDEFSYAWQGLSLKKYGIPVAWTLNSGTYKDQKYNPQFGNLKGFGIEIDGKLIDRGKFRLNPRPLVAVAELDYAKGVEQLLFVGPFFDHSPLGGLIYSLGVDKKVTEFGQVKAGDFRKPALVLAVITAISLFILLSLVTGNPWIGCLSVIIYSTVPTYLLGSRVALLENTAAPLVMVHLILLFLFSWAYKKYKGSNYSYILLALSGLFGGLAALAKEPAIGFLIGSLAVLIINKMPKKSLLVLGISALVPIAIYVVWGMSLQKDLFLGIFLANANRGYFGAIKPITMLEALKFKNFPTDGWWIWGIISFLFVSTKVKNKKLLFLIIPLAAHILVTLFLGSPNYPWYWLTAVPLLAGCSAIFIWRIITKPTITSALAFFLIPFSSSYYWGRVALGLEADINHYRFAFLVFAGLMLARLKLKNYKIVQLIWIVFMAILIRKIVIFNQVFFPYMIAHWGNLPVPSLPSF